MFNFLNQDMLIHLSINTCFVSAIAFTAYRIGKEVAYSENQKSLEDATYKIKSVLKKDRIQTNSEKLFILKRDSKLVSDHIVVLQNDLKKQKEEINRHCLLYSEIEEKFNVAKCKLMLINTELEQMKKVK